MKALSENQLRYLVRSKLRIILEKTADAPMEKYQPASKENLYLDRSMQVGGWPEGEYEPSVPDRLTQWYKDMGLMEHVI